MLSVLHRNRRNNVTMTFKGAVFVAVPVGLLPSSGSAQEMISPISGQPGRVVILDASGSMRNLSFASPERERMDVARDFLSATFSELADIKDATPTSLVVFGSDQRLTWDSPTTEQITVDPSLLRVRMTSAG